MKLPVNTFKKAIADGTPQIGLWISLCNNFSAEIIAPSGYDWVVLDMEHSPNEVGIVMGQLQAFNGATTTPMVRPMWNDPVVTKRLMDVGANTLLFPMVQSPEEAEAAVRATRYPPHGIRGVSGGQRGNRFGRVTDYFDRILDETCVIVQIWASSAIRWTRRSGKRSSLRQKRSERPASRSVRWFSTRIWPPG
jgi:4-hydroxy-2-oxoheptanedioate aldolase